MMTRVDIQLKPTECKSLLSDRDFSEVWPHQFIKRKHAHTDILSSVVQTIKPLEEHQLFRGGIGLPADLLKHQGQPDTFAAQPGQIGTGPQCLQDVIEVQCGGTSPARTIRAVLTNSA